jgi:hypothetical protein
MNKLIAIMIAGLILGGFQAALTLQSALATL